MRALWLAPLALALLAAPLASAHAVLQSATPPPNGHVDEGLESIEIVFTEDVEREYTKADVIDLRGDSWAAGPTVFDPARGNVIRLPVRPLESGLYAVSWQTLSVDTHTARGSYVFAVGTAELRYALDTSAHDHAEHSPTQLVKEGGARAAFYAGLFLAVGIPVFAIVVLRDAAPRGMLRSAGLIAVLGAMAGGVSLHLLSDRTGLPYALALSTGAGTALAWRALLLLAAGLVLVAASFRERAPRWSPWVALALGAGATLATALGSHAAASEEATALLIVADAAHLLMAAVWIGGVVAFLHLLAAGGAADMARLVVRFSPLAVGSVAVLLLTGTIASVAHVPCLRGQTCAGALLREPYAVLVLVKLGLLVPLAAMGGYNKYVLGPRLERPGASPRAFRRVIQAEALLMVVVLSAAGILAATPPPDGVVQSGETGARYLELQNTTRTSHVILQVRPEPVTVGVQQVRVLVHPLSGALPNTTTVQLKVWGPGERQPETTIGLEKVAPDEWAIEEGLFTRAGAWNVTVLLQRPDEFAKLKFQVPVVNPT